MMRKMYFYGKLYRARRRSFVFVVKVIKIDDKGRINLTIKGVTEEDKAKLNA